MESNLLKSKSFWGGVSGIIGGLAVGFTSGDWVQGGEMIWAGLVTIFIRQAIAKK